MESPSKTARKRKHETLTEKSLSYFEEIDEKLNDCGTPSKKKKTHRCNLCNYDFNGSNKWNLTSHLQTKHPDVFSQLSGGKFEPTSIRRLKLLQNCTEIVSVNGRTFSSLMDSGFQAAIRTTLDELQAAKHGLNLSHNNLAVVKEHMTQTAQKVREKIKAEVAGRPLSLLADIATKHKRSILGISVQYTFNGELKVRSIGFIELCERHTGKNLAETIINRLHELGINLKQIITVTTDNGKNVLKMVREMTDYLVSEIESKQISNQNEQTESAQDSSNEADVDTEIVNVLAQAKEITDDEALERCYDEVAHDMLLRAMTDEIKSFGTDVLWEIFGIKCAAHVLQLTVQDAMKLLGNNVANVIELVREVAKLLRLKSTCTDMARLGFEYRLPRAECTTRWGASYLLVRILNFYAIFIDKFFHLY